MPREPPVTRATWLSRVMFIANMPRSHHEGDAAVFLACRPDGNLHVLTQGGEKIHEALDGEGAGTVAHQYRHTWLLDAEDLPRLRLSEPTLLDEAVNLQREARFQKFLLGMDKPEVGEDVSPALFELHRLLRGHISSSISIYIYSYIRSSRITRSFRWEEPRCNCVSHLLGKRVHIVQGQSLRRDGRVHDDFRLARPHMIGVRLEDVGRSVHGDGHNRHSREDGKVKAPPLEWQQLTVAAAMALGEEQDGFSPADFLRHLFHAPHGFLRPVAVQGDVPGAPHVPAHEGHVKQRALGHEAKLHGQAPVQDGNVHGALVIYAINRSQAGVGVLQTFHAHTDSADFQNQPRPHPRAGMLPPALRVEEGPQQRNCSANCRAEINEEIGEQQGARVAQEVADAATPAGWRGDSGRGGFHDSIKPAVRWPRRRPAGADFLRAVLS